MLPPNEVSFGPFRLVAAERRLEKSGTAVRIGGRALDILILLIEHTGAVVEKQTILERVWRGVNVDEVSMRVHINALRKALGDGIDGARYIINVAGRGYSFVAAVENANQEILSPTPTRKPVQASNLPRPLARMIGRGETVQEIVQMLLARRFVSVIGPGGIGKTTVAISAGREMQDDFDAAVHFIDLGPLNDPEFLPNAILSALGITVYSDDLTESLIAYLRDKKLLLILDGCEHVIEAAAELAERIFIEASQVHLLATSREMLQVEGEWIYRLSPLATPADKDVGALKALEFPAIQLFVERAAAASSTFELNDGNAPFVAEICRKLDGIALAIELAASRVDAYGIRAIAELLTDRFTLPWRGRRTAAPRHQTLRATLDWSYNLLSDLDRIVLSRLSIFVGQFTREAAAAVALFGGVNNTHLLEALASLAGKSLLTADVSTETTHYRLLDMTRAYALEKLLEREETQIVSKLHAIHYCNITREIVQRVTESPGVNWKSQFSEHVANIRLALEWSMAHQASALIAMELAAVSARLFLEFTLFAECHRWMAQALTLLDETARGTLHELEIQIALAQSMMFAKGGKQEALAAFTRGLELAEGLNDLDRQLQILTNLHLFHERIGDFKTAFGFAKRSEKVANRIGDAPFIAVANSVLGISYHLAGEHMESISRLKSALFPQLPSRRLESIYFGFDYNNRARITVARALWIQGCPDQALEAARATVAQATQLGHPITLCIALIWAISVLIWTKQLGQAEEYVAILKDLAHKHALEPYQPLALGFAAELSIHRGEPATGVPHLRECLDLLEANRYGLMTSAFMTALAEGLCATQRHDEALDAIDATTQHVHRRGDFYILPEVLRVKGMILENRSDTDLSQAEKIYLESIELAERQGALGWKLRAATSLAKLYDAQGRRDQGQALLLPIYAKFSEGFETSDLITTRRLLVE
jgi:predicted ATPase/DNA-binding winged helix-turn-helix (wHTH) protein